jgi:hypothetical protein
LLYATDKNAASFLSSMSQGERKDLARASSERGENRAIEI